MKRILTPVATTGIGSPNGYSVHPETLESPSVVHLHIVAMIGLIAVIGACGGNDLTDLETRVASLETRAATSVGTATATPRPDKVVGITWVCEVFTHNTEARSAQGDECRLRFRPDWCGLGSVEIVENCVYPQFVVATVTVRQADGTIYTVSVQDPDSDIDLSMVWPP